MSSVKDPRADVYKALEDAGLNDLKDSLKGYFEKLVTKDDSLRDVEAFKKQAEEAQAKFAEMESKVKEFEAQTPPDPNKDLLAKVEALTTKWEEAEKKAEEATRREADSALTSDLNTRLGKIPAEIRNGLITSLKTEGYSINGKTFKAQYADGKTGFVVDALDTTPEEGVNALLEAGLNKYVSGDAGGGFPSFDTPKEVKPKQSFDDSINSFLKGE